MLELEGIIVQYGEGAPALDGLDLTAGTGSVTAVVGGNGAGKTTLMRTLSGVLGFSGAKVQRGSATFMGSSLVGAAAHQIVRRGIAHVPEGRKVFADLTVEENLIAGAATRRGGNAARLAEVYKMFPVLAERRGGRAVLLSGGEQQMLAIGRGLMSDPRLLLLDEPTLGLAPRLVDQIGQIVGQIRDRGTSVLLVEQNAAMALSVADRGYVLEQGRAVLSGSAAELRATDAVQHLYLGGSAADEADGARPRGTPRIDLARWSA